MKIRQSKPAFDGAHSRHWWATRDDGAVNSVDAYWNGRDHPARQIIGRTVAALPGDTLLEVGCHIGANLWAVTQKRRMARLAGTELSGTVLAAAQERLPRAIDQPVELVKAGADALPFSDRSFDVVLTSVMLVCIGPESIKQSLRELCRVSRRWIVIAEPFEDRWRYATAKGRLDAYPNTMYWIRNYPLMLRRVEGATIHSVARLPPDHRLGHLDSIVVLELPQSKRPQ